MRINTKIRYGLRMLVLLAEAKKLMSTAELGKKMQVSPKYLRKLAGPLERHHLIKSEQGIYGGYTLAKNPRDITLTSLFEAFEENVNITGCSSKSGCPLNEECLTRPVWEHLENLISQEFKNITIHAIVNDSFKSHQP